MSAKRTVTYFRADSAPFVPGVLAAAEGTDEETIAVSEAWVWGRAPSDGSFTPQSPQKITPSAAAERHDGQMKNRGLPQRVQYFVPLRLTCEQSGQFVYVNLERISLLDLYQCLTGRAFFKIRLETNYQ